MSRRRTALVTGGCGFIGSHLVRRLVDRGWRVVNLDRLTYAGDPRAHAALRDRAEYREVVGDIADRALVAGILSTERPSAVFHLAAESHVDRSIDGPAEFVATNVVGTVALLEAVTDHWRTLDSDDPFRFLHVSTDEVFGSLGASGQFTEASRYDPRSPYSASKAAADHFVRAWHATYGTPVLLTNSSNNYGPHQHPEKLIPTMILSALAGRPLPVYGDGGHVRDWLYVEDHCRALETIAIHGRIGETYLIGGGHELTNLELVHQIAHTLDRLAPRPDNVSHATLITHVADRPGHDRRYAIDCSKLTAEFGWRTETDWRAGLERTITWYLEHQDWCASRVATTGLARRGQARDR